MGRAGQEVSCSQSVTTILDELRRVSNWDGEFMKTVFDIFLDSLLDSNNEVGKREILMEMLEC